MRVFDPRTDSPAALIEELAYANYRYNRQRSPSVTPEQWATVYGAITTQMEQRYQEERTDETYGQAVDSV